MFDVESVIISSEVTKLNSKFSILPNGKFIISENDEARLTFAKKYEEEMEATLC